MGSEEAAVTELSGATEEGSRRAVANGLSGARDTA